MKQSGKRPAGGRAGLSPEDTLQRQVLPVPDWPHPEAHPPRPPADAPHVLLILLDDVGFGASSVLGGVIQTPTAERLSVRGLKYPRFHTPGSGPATRASLLTGRNPHAAGFGGGRPNHCAPLAEILRLNGYSTAQFGKCHEVPAWETSPVGPFDRWPTRSGFEHFFGFVGEATQPWHPALYENTTPVVPDRTPEQGYHFLEDVTDRAICWLRQQRTLAWDKPFFLYFSPGATHAPHQVPREWADRYTGRFDAGWDSLREEIFARQKRLGVLPRDCELAPRPDGLPAWADMPEKLRPVLARQMEVYAGYLEYADFQVGRLITALDQLGALEDTLVFYILGDGGGATEGTVTGTLNEGLLRNGLASMETAESLAASIHKAGTPEALSQYSVGWAHALETPFPAASRAGGTRSGTVVHWPAGMRARGELRSQFTHAVDVAPTVLEAARLPPPVMVNGVPQTPMHGVSMLYSFDGAQAPERHETQYFALPGSRGIYHRGWMAVSRPGDDWTLHDTAKDPARARDLAAELPEKLRELQHRFLVEAARCSALPLDGQDLGRPVMERIQGDSQLLSGLTRRIRETALLDLKNTSHAITAEVVVPDSGAQGVILTQGSAFGGWCLYAREGRLAYGYNFGGLRRYCIEAHGELPQGTHQVRMEFQYDGGGEGRGGDVRLFVDGLEVGRGRVEETLPRAFSQDETAGVGMAPGSPVVEGFHSGNSRFSGRVKWLRLERRQAAAASAGAPMSASVG
jgi:arylsulfatase